MCIVFILLVVGCLLFVFNVLCGMYLMLCFMLIDLLNSVFVEVVCDGVVDFGIGVCEFDSDDGMLCY